MCTQQHTFTLYWVLRFSPVKVHAVDAGEALMGAHCRMKQAAAGLVGQTSSSYVDQSPLVGWVLGGDTTKAAVVWVTVPTVTVGGLRAVEQQTNVCMSCNVSSRTS